jgi:TonB family protein
VLEQTTTEETTTEATTPSTAATQTRTQTTTRRRQVAAVEYVPEQVIGVEPASATYNDEDAIVVQGQRRPVWTRTPSAQRLSIVYPERALEGRREGEASVHCTVQQDGRLACVQFSETPLHAGFGTAALRVARLFRHAPARADGSSAVGSPVNLRVVFRMSDNDRRG